MPTTARIQKDVHLALNSHRHKAVISCSPQLGAIVVFSCWGVKGAS